jgi:YggT family protein
MNSTYLTVPIIFLIDSLFSLYILAVLLRFLLQWVKADFYNPVCHFLVKVTHPPLKVLRRFIPPLGKIDSSSIVLALILQMMTNLSILLLQDIKSTFVTLLIFSCAHLVELTINIFIFAIFAQALLRWFNPNSYNPAFFLLESLSNPVLAICRRAMPDLGGDFDLSPLAALMMLQLSKMLIMPPLEKLAYLLG